MKVYALKSCDTCRKAIKALREVHGELDVVDIRLDGMDVADVAAIVEAVGFERALNRNSLTWRGLDDPDKRDLDNVKAVQMIKNHPTLMKRPAIVDGDKVTVGWKDDAQAVWL